MATDPPPFEGDLDGAPIAVLKSLFTSTYPGERAGAACAVGDRLRTREILKVEPQIQEALSLLLDDPLPHVRFEAAIAMAELHDFRATSLLLGAAQSRGLRLDAIRALGTMGDTKAVGELHKILNRFFMPWADKLQAAAALCALNDETGQEYLRTKLSSRKHAERAAAIHFMAESKHPRAIEELVTILQNLGDPMRDVAARSLGLLPSQPGLVALQEALPNAQGDFAEDIVEAIQRHGKQPG